MPQDKARAPKSSSALERLVDAALRSRVGVAWLERELERDRRGARSGRAAVTARIRKRCTRAALELLVAGRTLELENTGELLTPELVALAGASRPQSEGDA